MLFVQGALFMSILSAFYHGYHHHVSLKGNTVAWNDIGFRGFLLICDLMG